MQLIKANEGSNNLPHKSTFGRKDALCCRDPATIYFVYGIYSCVTSYMIGAKKQRNRSICLKMIELLLERMRR